MAKTVSNPILQLIRRVIDDQQGRQLSDQELLRRFTDERDETAFHTLLRRHGPMVLDVCRGLLGNEADAEDAFQTTFLILARTAASIRKTASLGSWLHGVAHRTALKTRAQSATRRKNEARAPARQTSEQDDLTWWEVRQVLHEELTALAERYRVPLVACYLEGKTQDEAAVQLGLAKSTLKERLERGRSLLRARLVRRGLGPAAVLLATAWPSVTASACLPATLVSSTVKAAHLVAAGRATTASVIPTKVVALTEGARKTMLLTKLKIVTAVLIVTAVAAAGAGLIRLPAPAAEPQPPKTDKPVPKGGPEPEPAKPIVVRERALLQRMAMSADGAFVATVGVTRDGETYTSTVKLWDARTGKLKRALDEVKDSHLELALSRDFLAIGVNGKLQDTDPRGPREVRLLDANTLELKHKIDEYLVPGVASWSALAFSPDGKRLAVAGFAEGAFVKLWDVEKQKLIEGKAALGEISRELNRVGCLAFSPDGKVVAAAWDDGKIRLFDGRTGDFATVLDPELKPGSSIAGIAFSPDSKVLASKGSNNTAVLWDLTEGKPRWTLKGHKGAVSAVAFSGDGRWIATGARTAKEDDYEVILWDTKTRKVIHTFPSLTEPVHVLAFSPDGKTLVVCGGGGRGEGQDLKMSGELTLFRLK